LGIDGNGLQVAQLFRDNKHVDIVIVPFGDIEFPLKTVWEVLKRHPLSTNCAAHLLYE